MVGTQTIGKLNSRGHVGRKHELDELIASFGRHVHEVHPNPGRIGCPEESVLKDLVAQKSAAPALLEHIRSCAPCVEKLKQLNGER